MTIVIPGTLIVWRWGFLLRLVVIDIGAGVKLWKAAFRVSKA